MNQDLFDLSAAAEGWQEAIGPGATHLHGFAIDQDHSILAAVAEVQRQAPYRHLITPGGHRMSVAMTNCGRVGWHSSPGKGYQYTAIDPLSGQPWPRLPDVLAALAQSAAQAAGYPAFSPDACLINCYTVGSKMSLHQDKDEGDLTAPIVSVSLGLPATFLWGGMQRNERPQKRALRHGDVLVWGGPDRLRFHGVSPIKPGNHKLTGETRINITFRKALD